MEHRPAPHAHPAPCKYSGHGTFHLARQHLLCRATWGEHPIAECLMRGSFDPRFLKLCLIEQGATWVGTSLRQMRTVLNRAMKLLYMTAFGDTRPVLGNFRIPTATPRMHIPPLVVTESENKFSLLHAASSTSGRAKRHVPISL